ncbi:uncharacterized protein SCHCODRAFT_02557466 [Schizophyllum commune H4-8]|uniref:uncharacterized protein n=1 Tax=Schizophyllum commune (strain H4-8 / FGSC 9210) TaxID=578458 RepID=UPI00215F911A|nr:uncharacterized protein SCHCODRAFT_02557466 [Schizophyllum commune H4-8]KAI5885266.1 hypothetical protein SCHCODRAFT_02557466 [Schizophyllum commune H4-8]
MHAVLRTPELRHTIFKDLTRYDLTALAIACKEFSGEALSMLWSYCFDIRDILDLLPDAKKTISRVNRKRVVGARGDLTLQDISRISFYAAFIRTLDVDFKDLRASESGMQQIVSVAAASGQELFPNLRELRYHGPTDFAPCLTFLLAPTLTKLTVIIEASDERWRSQRAGRPVYGATELSILLGLKARDRDSPRIASLHLRVHTDLPWPLDELLDGWDSLEDLCIEASINEMVLSSVFRLPRLHSLALDGTEWYMVDEATEWLSLGKLDVLPVASPILTHISLRLSSLAEASQVLAALTVLDLSQLYIEDVERFPALDAFVRLLGKRLEPAILLELVFKLALDVTMARHILGVNSNLPPEQRVHLDTLRPLLPFSNLVRFVLPVTSDIEIALDDDDVDTLARAWPRLEVLEVYTVRRPSPALPPVCTINALLSFARHCPLLRLLGMELDATIVRALDPSVVPVQSSLWRLQVHHSPIESPADVAAFLSTLFPNLESIQQPDHPSSRYNSGKWDTVQWCLPRHALGTLVPWLHAF